MVLRGEEMLGQPRQITTGLLARTFAEQNVGHGAAVHADLRWKLGWPPPGQRGR